MSENKVKRFSELSETNNPFAGLNTETDETFVVGEIISYNYEITAKVVKVHDDCKLLDVVLFHPKSGLITKPTSVATSLCVKFKEY